VRNPVAEAAGSREAARDQDAAAAPDGQRESGRGRPVGRLVRCWERRAGASQRGSDGLLRLCCRYTVTYTPSEDRILPSPPFLHVRIRNSSAIPLRAAYLHGPYTIHVSAYPSTFNPNKKEDDSKIYGNPEFEPNVKAGGHWNAKLTVPEHIRQGDGSRNEDGSPQSATWVIEVASQIIFSNSASVNYELLVARDERSLDLGFTAVTGNSHGTPGKVQDHQQGSRKQISSHPAQPKGVYSKAIRLVVDDTTSLWNKPELPELKEEHGKRPRSSRSSDAHHEEPRANGKQKHIHLVLVTHGLHSNLGADMLYLKESIDATARQAREDRRKRRREQREAGQASQDAKDTSTAPLSGGQDEIPEQQEDDDDEEEVVVRGFDGNVIKTERGIQYLGKRLAKYVLALTYPDQPFLPVKRSVGQKISSTFSPIKDKPDEGIPAHDGSTVQRPPPSKEKRLYKFTSISFIGHSLGGLVQTYAIAYIHKHSPTFFENIKPINFICMASPMLGLSNENPMYVKFALDFGLVGRTGQDLGLTWRTPTIARSGWTAMSSVFGNQPTDQHDHEDPGAKPLLRILPTGPAHLVLRMFRNRTLYSNVVNDGIVPLRTSCLLFLDWRGLDRVDKARRENGLIGTVAVWGFGQLTGQSASPNPSKVNFSDEDSEGALSPSLHGDDTTVPLPSADTTNQDDEAQTAAGSAAHQVAEGRKSNDSGEADDGQYFQPQNTLMQWWSYIRPTGKHTTRDKKMFHRSQTVQKDDDEESSSSGPSSLKVVDHRKRPQATRGDSITNNNSNKSRAPPKTTIFESAGDLINPPVPPQSWIVDPSSRARTIFHDRIYHPEDIPPPPTKKRPGRSMSVGSNHSQGSTASTDEGQMRVEEKIARAYHKDLSWRKVLVRLEPDAHNNMIVRRMFANAYGWPVVKHLCDTHFAATYSAETRDEDEPAIDRAKGVTVPVKADGEHVRGQGSLQPPIERTDSELREVPDELAPLKSLKTTPKRTNTMDSTRSIGSGDWDAYFGGTSDEEDENDDRNAIQKFLQLNNPRMPTSPGEPKTPHGTSEAEISEFLAHNPAPVPIEVHRGIGISPNSKSQKSSKSSCEPDSLQSLGGPSNFLPEERLSASPPETASGNLSELGLRVNKSRDKSAPSSPVASKARRGSGLSEQVARLSVERSRDGKNSVDS
jgi:hypothetical protein